MSIRHDIQNDVGRHGEVHVVVDHDIDGLEPELDLRQSQTKFHQDVVEINYPDAGKISLPYHSIVLWYVPGAP